MDKTYTVEVKFFKDTDEGGWIAEVPELHCYTQADTYEEVVFNIEEAISCYLESLAKFGEDIPIESDQEKQEKVGLKRFTKPVPATVPQQEKEDLKRFTKPVSVTVPQYA